jgi:integrase
VVREVGQRPENEQERATATVEDLRNYQLHLVDHGTPPTSLNAAITGLKFFFDVTLGQPELMARMLPVRVPRKLPVVLSPDEVRRLIAAAGNLKHQTALSVAYGAGLRASEVVALKVSDIDSQRMALRIEQGKGRKDRYAMLSPVLLERLRLGWRVGATLVLHTWGSALTHHPRVHGIVPGGGLPPDGERWISGVLASSWPASN